MELIVNCTERGGLRRRLDCSRPGGSRSDLLSKHPAIALIVEIEQLARRETTP